MARGLSERAHYQVLETATHLFAERAIAATASMPLPRLSGVSKGTTYSRAQKKAVKPDER